MTLAFDSLAAFLGMGGYGGYVWPAYAVTFVILIGLVIAARHARQQAERDWRAFEREDAARPGDAP